MTARIIDAIIGALRESPDKVRYTLPPVSGDREVFRIQADSGTLSLLKDQTVFLNSYSLFWQPAQGASELLSGNFGPADAKLWARKLR